MTPEPNFSLTKTLRNLVILSAIFCGVVFVVGNITNTSNSSISNKISDWEISGSKEAINSNASSTNSEPKVIDLTQPTESTLQPTSTEAALANTTQNSEQTSVNQTQATPSIKTVTPSSNPTPLNSSTPSQNDANLLDQQLVNPDNLNL